MRMTPYSVYWTHPGILIRGGFVKYIESYSADCEKLSEDDGLFLKLLKYLGKPKQKMRFIWIE